MRDGKALQMATSHELGQNFARAFDITYTDEDGAQQLLDDLVGRSTRMVGGLIMGHGDDAGLRLPPRIAPTQVVVVVGRTTTGRAAARRAPRREIAAAGVRVARRRRTDWLRPPRHRLGAQGRAAADRGRPARPRAGEVTLVRRDPAANATTVPLAGAAAAAAVLTTSSAALAQQAPDAAAPRTVDVDELARGRCRPPRLGPAALAPAVGTRASAASTPTPSPCGACRTPDGGVPDHAGARRPRGDRRAQPTERGAVAPST